MKLKKITISGMHKAMNKTYDLDDIVYFIGENGAGKSTILEAIQLALLGYIPGYAKTNESIMKHSSAPVLLVEAEFDDDTKITRTWTRKGTSAQSALSVSGPHSSDDISSMLSEIELPIFDFNEFKSMTANKLKEWFISFLPSSTDDLDLVEDLKNSLGNRVIASDELYKDVENFIAQSQVKGVDLIKALNAKFKEDQSYTKGQIAKLEGTIQSLIRYDEAVDLDEDAINAEIKQLTDLNNQLIQYQTAAKMRENALVGLESLKSELSADSFENDPEASRIKEQMAELQKKRDIMVADYEDVSNQIKGLEQKKAFLPKAGSTCPYTNEVCETAAALADKAKAEAEEIQKEIDFKKSELQEFNYSEIDRELLQLTAQFGTIQSKYDRLVSMQLQIDGSDVGECPTKMSLDDIKARLDELRGQLVQIAANKKYDELSSTVTADKFKLDNELECYKIWDKRTGANGLQTELMNKPFESLADDMSEYLSKMFNTPVVAKFNLVAKANSFSFGIERDGNYIEFDYLSSGERCLFTLALMMCILNKTESPLRIILIDDILDHLDGDNAKYLFNTLKSIEGIQFILAGVKECDDPAICKAV